MKKLLILICSIVGFLVGLLIWGDQSRDYCCFSDGKCFTIWQHDAGGCYLIPGRYRSIFTPKENYLIKKERWRGLGVISDKRQPGKIIVEGDSSCQLIQKQLGSIVFYNTEGHNKKFDSIYTDNGHYNHDLEYYSVDVEDMTVETNVNHGAGIMSLTKTGDLWPFIVFIVCGISLIPLSVILVFKLMDKLRKE